MSDPDLFVVCNNCGSEVSPYVTECPYCGKRLRKRAPDLNDIERQRKRRDERNKKRERKAAIAASRTQRPRARQLPGYLASSLPLATTALIFAAVAASIAARASGFPYVDLVLIGDIGTSYWVMFSAPFLHGAFGYGFVALLCVAIFGKSLEERFGPLVIVGLWLACGAAGVMTETLLAPAIPHCNGANGVASGMLAAWLAVVFIREDPRDVDAYGLIAVGAVLLALPIATEEASVWASIGGAITGGFAGWLLSRVHPNYRAPKIEAV